MLVTLDTLSRKSDTAAAILHYCDEGAVEIYNLAAERALRGVPIGHRNYLFSGADGGGERAAAIYSLIGTAKPNCVNPRSLIASRADAYRRSFGQAGRWFLACELHLTGSPLRSHRFPAV